MFPCFRATRPAAGPSLLAPILVLCAASAASQTHLQPITVTATRFSESASSLPFGVSVIEAADIRAAGVSSVNQAIVKLLGVPGRLDFYGGGDYTLDMRGFGTTADNNQVVIVDGVRISEADLGGTRLAGISIDSVERIEVIRGSGAVLYGEGATGGVIVITTKAGQGGARSNAANVYAAAGSYGLRDLRSSATVGIGRFSIDASADHREADNHRDNFHSKTDGASVTGQWNGDGWRAGVRHAYEHLHTGLPGGLTAQQYADNPRQSTKPDDNATIRGDRSSVFGVANVGAWELGVDAGWRDKALESVTPGSTYAYDIGANTFALRAKHAMTFGGGVQNNFIAGLDHDRWERETIFGAAAHQRTQAVYLKDELSLAGGTLLSAGWRTSSVRKDNSDSGTGGIHERPKAWELGVVQPVAAGVAVFGRFGRSFRLPNVDEFGFTTPGVALKTQTSRDAELGARWTHAGGRAEVRVYRSALSNEIGYDPKAVGPFSPGFDGANVNFDRTRREGLELEAVQALTANANLRVNAATRRARFSAGSYAGRDVPLTPRQTLAVHADWSPAAGHRIDGGVNVVSSQHPDFDNACRMPKYATADLRYAYQWNAAELALAIENLTDRKYYTQAFDCVNGAVSSIYPEAGRAFMASVRVHF